MALYLIQEKKTRIHGELRKEEEEVLVVVGAVGTVEKRNEFRGRP